MPAAPVRVAKDVAANTRAHVEALPPIHSLVRYSHVATWRNARPSRIVESAGSGLMLGIDPIYDGPDGLPLVRVLDGDTVEHVPIDAVRLTEGGFVQGVLL